MNIRFTRHAEDMLQERDLSRELIEKTVIGPDWTEKENGKWHAFKRIGRRTLRVVVVTEGKCHIVITAYYDRRLNR